jgi:FkbM family methyltransferase
MIVVEPDSDNISLCRKNLAPYSRSVQIVHKGVWSKPVGLKMSGSGWGTKVREAGPQEKPDVAAIDIPSLLAMTPRGEADLLKVDIEWSELAVFGDADASWLSHIRNIAIELHDAECESVFFRALEPYHYDLSRCGELTFCRNIHLRPARVGGAADSVSSENDLNRS